MRLHRVSVARHVEIVRNWYLSLVLLRSTTDYIFALIRHWKKKLECNETVYHRLQESLRFSQEGNIVQFSR
jgi:hypothetical protein